MLGPTSAGVAPSPAAAGSPREWNGPRTARPERSEGLRALIHAPISSALSLTELSVFSEGERHAPVELAALKDGAPTHQIDGHVDAIAVGSGPVGLGAVCAGEDW